MPSSEWVRGPGLFGQWASQWWVLSPRPASLPGTPDASGSSSLKIAVRLPVWGCGERGVCQYVHSVWRDRDACPSYPSVWCRMPLSGSRFTGSFWAASMWSPHSGGSFIVDSQRCLALLC